MHPVFRMILMQLKGKNSEHDELNVLSAVPPSIHVR